MKKRNRILALLAALSLLPGLLSGCSTATAATMKLVKTKGTVSVSDAEGKSLEPREDLGLYSGYGVDTQAESYAWIDLDDVKLVKLDEDSEIAITKEDKKLEVEVKSGSLFFNVTEPLADDETMNIRTSTMLVGIRGTCGWVTQTAAALLEGTVEVTAGEQSVTITAGEMAYLTENGELVVKSFYQEDIPAFVAEEPLGGDILNEIPAIYPLTVLTKQTIYDIEPDVLMIVEYFYDEEGYALRRNSCRNSYFMGEMDNAETSTFSYDGKGHCLVTYYNGETVDIPCVPGNYVAYASVGEAFSNPMVTGFEDNRSKIGPDGRLDLDYPIYGNDGILLSGYYAIYNMDANGYPIHIDTYSSDGVLIGTADLEWAVIDP